MQEEVIKYKWEVEYRGHDGKLHTVKNCKEYTNYNECDRDMCNRASDFEEAGYTEVQGDIYTYEYGIWRRGF